MHLAKSRSSNGYIFKATFIDDTPAGTECLVRYGYNPSWDFVKGSKRPCVPDNDWQDEPNSSKDAAEKKHDENEEEAPKSKKTEGKRQRRSRSKKNKVHNNNNANQVDDGSTSAQSHVTHIPSL